MSSSSFPQNMAQGRTYNANAPYPPRVIQVAYRPVPPTMRQPLGLSARPDSIGFNNHPPMGQFHQPSQQTSGQAGGNSIWPLVAGGAALAGVVYYGYNWLTKPKAEETAETTAETIEHSEEALAEGATKSEAAVLAKDAATEASTVSSSVSAEGSTLAKAAEGAVGAIEKEVSEVVQKGVEKAPSMMSRISNALSHKAVMIPAGLAAAAAAEYAYPVARPLFRAYAPVVAEYAAKSPALAADLWQGARQTVGNAILNLRYSGASTCAVPAKETLQSLSQAVCKPGEEPLTYLAGQQASSLWNYGAASLSALGTGVSGWFGSTAAKEGAEKLGQCSANVLESGAKNVGQCGLDEAPSYVSQKLSEGGQYLSGLFGSALEGAKSLVGGAGSKVAPEIVSSGNSAASSLTCPVPSLGEQLAKAAEASSIPPTSPNVPSYGSSLMDLFKGTPKNPVSPVGSGPVPPPPTSPNVPSYGSSLVDLFKGTPPKNPVCPVGSGTSPNVPSYGSSLMDLFKGTPKNPVSPVGSGPVPFVNPTVPNVIPPDVLEDATRLAKEQVAKSGGIVSEKMGQILKARGYA